MNLMITAIVLSGLAEVLAEASGRRRIAYVLKPLTTALIIVVAAAPNPVSNIYRGAIVAGLVLSLAGDVFLMLPVDRFVAGLASFLAAHLCYIVAFVSVGSSKSVVAGMLLIAWGAFLLGQLWARLGRLRSPVAVYAAVLMVMAWTAIGTSAAAATGAVLFVISDSVLALERFGRAHRWGRAVVQWTYVAAQLLIALSTAGGG